MNEILTNIAAKSYRFVISGGGTGGHLFPAIAIANKLSQKFPGCGILFVGALGRMEMEKVPATGYPIIGLPIEGFQRKQIFNNINLPYKMLKSLIISGKILKTIKPQVVIGTGGYASFPLVYRASKMKIPSIIQEQNFFPGKSNMFLSKYVNKVCVIDEKLKAYFPENKIVVTGNPVRENLVDFISAKPSYYLDFDLKPGNFTLLVLGGSLGAKTINESILGCYESLLDNDIQMIWQTGKFYYQGITQKIHTTKESSLCIKPFIDQMEKAYAIADLVVCRAGAITLSELALLKKPAILIPSPNVAEDHQTKNALSLVDKKAAIMVTDNLARETLSATILNIFKDKSTLTELSSNIYKLANPDSTELIVNEVLKLIKV